MDCESCRLDQANASGAWPLVALANGVFHFLTFFELVKSGAFDFLGMKEQILAVASNESKALVAYQFLDLTLRHELPSAAVDFQN